VLSLLELKPVRAVPDGGKGAKEHPQVVLPPWHLDAKYPLDLVVVRHRIARPFRWQRAEKSRES
jgi:hypothetical protein